MKASPSNRRKFIKNIAASTAGLAFSPVLPLQAAALAKNLEQKDPVVHPETKYAAPRIRFSVIGINHGHIYSMVEAVIRGGGELVGLYALEPNLRDAFVKRYPQVKVASHDQEILDDKSIQLVLSSGIPIDRAPLGIKVMQHGKDYLVDKPGIITLDQLATARKVQKSTGRIYSIMFSERFENRGTVKAGELVKAGAIGKVVQTVIMAPHKMDTPTRPDWFFDRKRFGGILTDIGSHQFDQYLYFTGTTKASIVAAQCDNVHHSQYPGFEDFGDVMLKGNGGYGYIRVDWFTPNGLKSWGDGRLTILGTDGYIEVRKNIDIAGHEGGNHLFIVNQQETKYIDCSKEPLPFGEQLVDDIINRTETAMPQEHCFLATELALLAQQHAWKANGTVKS